MHSAAIVVPIPRWVPCGIPRGSLVCPRSTPRVRRRGSYSTSGGTPHPRSPRGTPAVPRVTVYSADGGIPRGVPRTTPGYIHRGVHRGTAGYFAKYLGVSRGTPGYPAIHRGVPGIPRIRGIAVPRGLPYTLAGGRGGNMKLSGPSFGPETPPLCRARFA
jgi:hypothetical protein